MRRKECRPSCRSGSPSGRANSGRASTRSSGTFDLRIEALDIGWPDLLRIFRESGNHEGAWHLALVPRSLGYWHASGLDPVHGRSDHGDALLEGASFLRPDPGELRVRLFHGIVVARPAHAHSQDASDLRNGMGGCSLDERMAHVLEKRTEFLESAKRIKRKNSFVMKKELVELRVNGRLQELAIEPSKLLLDTLREDLHLKIGRAHV